MFDFGVAVFETEQTGNCYVYMLSFIKFSKVFCQLKAKQTVVTNCYCAMY